MKTFIITRNLDQTVINIGKIRYESGLYTKGMAQLIAEFDDVDVAIMHHANSICPDDCTARIVDTSDLPGGDGGLIFDKMFYGIAIKNSDDTVTEYRGWTDANPGTQVDVDMVGASEIAHVHRRIKREHDFAPLDEVIAKQIPGADNAAAENARQAIRDADTIVQDNIDAASNETELLTALADAGII
jgi:hypothetical protein